MSKPQPYPSDIRKSSSKTRKHKLTEVQDQEPTSKKKCDDGSSLTKWSSVEYFDNAFGRMMGHLPPVIPTPATSQVIKKTKKNTKYESPAKSVQNKSPPKAVRTPPKKPPLNFFNKNKSPSKKTKAKLAKPAPDVIVLDDSDDPEILVLTTSKMKKKNLNQSVSQLEDEVELLGRKSKDSMSKKKRERSKSRSDILTPQKHRITGKDLKSKDKNKSLLDVSSVSSDPFEFSMCASPLSPLPSSKFFNLRIRWKGKILLVKVSENDYGYHLRKKLAQNVDVDPRELIIEFEDVEIPFDEKKSLKQSKIGLGTIMSARRVVLSEEEIMEKDDLSLIRIKIQSADQRNTVTFKIKKTDDFRYLHFLYCSKRGLSRDQEVKFVFDGDAVSLDDTPNDLDLEGDECFDAIIS